MNRVGFVGRFLLRKISQEVLFLLDILRTTKVDLLIKNVGRRIFLLDNGSINKKGEDKC
jgi:hypothetical protein